MDEACYNYFDPGVPSAFVSKFGQHLTGFLSGFDRLHFRGTRRMLFQPAILELYLLRQGVLVKDFKTFAQGLTGRIKELAQETAAKAGRPMRYLPSWTQSKEDLARKIVREERIQTGLIAVFSTVEGCTSYTVRGNRETRKPDLVLRSSRCTHLYHYFLHEQFGLCDVQVQTWFPFTVDICLPGGNERSANIAVQGSRRNTSAFCDLCVPSQLQFKLKRSKDSPSYHRENS